MEKKPLHSISGQERLAVMTLFLLAFALRTVALTHIPPGLHNDEVIEIKMTETVAGGRLGVFFPEDIGSEALYFYFAAPVIKLLGHSVFAMRLPSVFLSMVSLAVLWAFTRRLLGPPVALTALAGLAIVFWPVVFGRIISHVVVLVPLAALAAYWFWRAALTPRGRQRAMWAGSGLWLGLAINGYTAARVLPAIWLVFGIYVLIADRAHWRQWWTGIAITLAVAALVVMPLFLYLARHPAADQLNFYDIDRPWVELWQGNLKPALDTALHTLGMFAFVGDPLPYYDIPGRPVLEPVGALLLAVGLLSALRRWRQPRYAFILAWFFIALLPGMLSQPAPNYTRTLGVQVVLFAFPGIAIAAALKRWRSGVLVIALALLFLGNLAWTVRDYFFVWPATDIVRYWHQSGLKAIADYLQADPDASPVVICVPPYLVDERDPWWKPAWQHMRYLLKRPDLSLRYYDCADTLVFVPGPARYAFPDQAHDAALDRFPVYRFLSAAPIEVLSAGPALILRAEPSLEAHLTAVAAESAVAWAPETGASDSSAQVPVNFGEDVEFLGYILSASALKAGQSLELVTYWRVIDALPPRLLQFTHLLNAAGAVVAQQDRLGLTSASLQPGDILVQIHRLDLPPDLAEGAYVLSIGLYTPADGARLQITQSDQPRGDRLWLKAIQVQR